MSVSTWTKSYAAAAWTDAEFRAYVQAIHDAITSFGWVQTSDTGQFNFTTATKPAAGGVAAPLFYRMNDALQATAPVVLKILPTQFSTNIHGFYAQVGTATNGSGTFVGVTTTQRSLQVGIMSAGVSYRSWASGGTSWLNFAGFNAIDNSGALSSVTSYNHCLFIERTKDNSGADTGQGVSVLTAYGTTVALSEQTLPLDGTAVPPTEASVFAMGPPVTSMAVGSNVGVSPHFAYMSRFLPAKLNVMGYSSADLAQFTQVSIPHYSSNRNFLNLGQQGTAGGMYRGGVAALQIAMRYE